MFSKDLKFSPGCRPRCWTCRPWASWSWPACWSRSRRRARRARSSGRRRRRGANGEAFLNRNSSFEDIWVCNKLWEIRGGRRKNFQNQSRNQMLWCSASELWRPWYLKSNDHIFVSSGVQSPSKRIVRGSENWTVNGQSAVYRQGLLVALPCQEISNVHKPFWGTLYLHVLNSLHNAPISSALNPVGPPCKTVLLSTLQRWPKKCVLGCVKSPPRPDAGSRNLGKAFLRY